MSILISIFGPSAAGKSTIADLLKDRIKDLHVIDFDVIKRQIPKYNWHDHAQTGRDLTLAELATAVHTKLPILLLMPSPKDKEEFTRISSVAKKYSYTLINIEITAPQEVLIERYKYRLANTDPSRKDWKFKTLDEFKIKLQKPYYKPTDTTSFNSSQKNPDEILIAIMNLIKEVS